MFPQQGLNYIKCARVRSKSHVILTNNISLLQVTRKQKHLKELMKLRPDLVGVPFYGHKSNAVSPKISVTCQFHRETYEFVMLFNLNHQSFCITLASNLIGLVDSK